MTETEWLGTDHPARMLGYLQRLGRADDRKLRLFACACCRRVWPLLTDERSRSAVEVSERFADGLAGQFELEAAEAEARNAIPRQTMTRGITVGTRAWREANILHAVTRAAWWAASDPRHAVHAAQATASVASQRGFSWGVEVGHWQCNLLRDLFGNPFQRVAFLPGWLTPNVCAVARLIYDERRFEAVPLLADALEDAGCFDEAILSHSRGTGTHVRGCWVLDAMVGAGERGVLAP